MNKLFTHLSVFIAFFLLLLLFNYCYRSGARMLMAFFVYVEVVMVLDVVDVVECLFDVV